MRRLNNAEFRKDQYKLFQDDITKAQLSNTEALDKYLFTLSSAFFGLSITFIDKVIDSATASSLWMLGLSWSLFVVVILICLWSFLLSNHSLDVADVEAREVFVSRTKDDIHNSKTIENYNDILRICSVLLFSFGLIFLLLFLFINLYR